MAKKKKKVPLRVVRRSGLKIEPLEERRVLAGVSMELIEQMLQSSSNVGDSSCMEGSAVVATFELPPQAVNGPNESPQNAEGVRYWIETTDPRFEVVEGKIRLIPGSEAAIEEPPVLFVRCQAAEAKVPLMTVVEDYTITFLDDIEF